MVYQDHSARLGALIAGLLGGWDATMQVLCLVMALDFVTGLMVAFHGKSKKTETGGLSSKAFVYRYNA